MSESSQNTEVLAAAEGAAARHLRAKLLTPQEVSHILSLSLSSVYRLAQEGTLPAVVVARRKRKMILRFRPESLERWLRTAEKGNSR